jgi:hypothetical protein
MDFYKNKKKLKVVRSICLLGSSVLLLINCFNSYFGTAINYFGIISNICLIVAMIISIKEQKKEDKKESVNC